MSSILTNNSAMVALDTLRNINKDLASVQNQISTGKTVSSAKDNSAIWAISTVMSTDVESFKTISDSLNLGSSTVGVARVASEKVTELLQDMKNLIVNAQGANVDRTKIQTEIGEIRENISSVVGAAQFNGLNLVDGSSSADMKILSSLDRSSSGTVSAAFIDVARHDLSISNSATGATFGGTAVTDTSIIDNGGTNAGTAATVADGGSQAITIASVADGNSYRLVLDDSGAANDLGQRTFEYVAGTDDSANSVAANLANQVSTFFAATGETNYTVSRADDVITITNNSGDDLTLTAASATGGTAGTSAGGLGNVSSIDVTTDAGATAALTSIESLLQTSIDAAAGFGSSQTRIENQTDFVSSLVDSMTSGIGGLVDADMEAASAKLQALQVQQQLGVQSLSIANQAPQTLLSLFR
ncbi:MULTISPECIES: flagellin [Hyphomonas]|nr:MULTISPECIES: flagellin [Hyphomonas]MBB41833.1 flagellin [Hyphomonas sp.]HAE25984.1 flagellin [Hyphomonas adhaerens]|tara:strand:+ start:4988 stop:6235 length:1248 start_codon:yes stop_codon:yes gene_type:complete